MARFAVTIALIFSLFLLSQARIQLNEPEENHVVVEWKPSSSNDVSDSTSNSNHLIDSDTEPKILLPSEKPREDIDDVLSEEVAEFESTDGAELPGSDVEKHHHHHHHHHKKHWFPFHFPFRFRFRFPFIFRSHCHSHHHHHHHANHTHSHHDHKNHSHCHHHHHHHKNHSHCHHHHHHHKNHSHWEMEEKDQMEKQSELRIAGEEIPYGDDMIKARKAGPLHGKRVHHDKPCEDNEEMKGIEEGKMKHHRKKCKKEKKHAGLISWFRKLFMHFH